MLVQVVTVENYSERGQWLKDLQIPGGRMRMEPGSTVQIGFGVWLRHRKQCRSWLRKVEDGRIFAHTLKQAKPIDQASATPKKKKAKRKAKAKAEHAPPQDIDSPTATETDGNPVPVNIAPAGSVKKPLEELDFKGVKAIAGELGIAWKIGMSKQTLIDAIRETRSNS